MTVTGLYLDPETGKRISTNSMLKTFRRCPKQTEFKYARRLKPKRLAKPLHRGTWIHSLLERFHSGEDWRQYHDQQAEKFNRLFDEEKEYYGDLPNEILTVMRSYIWHYKEEPWMVHETELTIDCPFPDGDTIFRGKVDALVSDQHGLWLVDHKSHKTLPGFDFRFLDTQSALYQWAWNTVHPDTPVNGFIWNYLVWHPAGIPALLKDGSRLSKRPCVTDYPTYIRALKKYKEENANFEITAEYRAHANYLRSQRYQFGTTQSSPLFRRDVFERTAEQYTRVAYENFRTSERMHAYDFESEGVERTVERSCAFMCSYTDLCMADLAGGNLNLLIKQNYTLGDPNDYYQDRVGENPGKE